MAMVTSNEDMELLNLCTSILRRSRDHDVIELCRLIMLRVTEGAVRQRKAGPFDRVAYQREYMRRRRAKQKAVEASNPFEGS